MLALVCKSSQFTPNSVEYLRLQSEADKLGRSITNRFHVLCLDAIRYLFVTLLDCCYPLTLILFLTEL